MQQSQGVGISFYRDVPRTLAENLAYRRDLALRARGDEKFQRSMWTACQYDFLFWLASYCWLYEPRPRFGANGEALPKKIPFIPWEHQELPIRQLRDVLGRRDVLVEKSRGEGMSWILVYLALHDWLFDPGSKIGFVSRSENEADDPENSDSLFWKIDWALAALPRWMGGVAKEHWKRNTTKHSLLNLRNGSQINADAATGAVFRGGRMKWAALDEFAFFSMGEDEQALSSSQGSTDSRLFISTVNGTGNAFHRLANEPSNRLKIVIDWKDNPSKNRGLYRYKNGVPRAIDPVNNPLPPHYSPPAQDVLDMYARLRLKGFKLESNLRSPWYDDECDRMGASPQKIAQELDRDYGGSMYRLFGGDFMAKAEATVMTPLVRGNLSYHPESLEAEFDRSDDGPMHLWCRLDHNMRPPPRQYVVGADVSTGLGGPYTTNSTLQVLDMVSLEQVFEFASPLIPPTDLADLAIALSRWFHTAYLIWESNGPGRSFTKQVLARRYENCYYRKNEWQRSGKRTRELGWASTPDAKEGMFGELLRSILKGELTVHSDALVKEFPQYVRIKGKISHLMADRSEDDAISGVTHGDRVIGLGVALIGARDRPMVRSKNLSEEYNGPPPPGSMAARKHDYDLAQMRANEEWDDRDIADLAAGGRGLRAAGYREW